MNCQMHEMIAVEWEFMMLNRSIVMQILKDESGASAMEYGLIIAMISVALIVSMQGLALGVNAVWSTATTQTNAIFGTSS